MPIFYFFRDIPGGQAWLTKIPKLEPFSGLKSSLAIHTPSGNCSILSSINWSMILKFNTRYYVTFIHGDESVTSGWVLDKDLRNFEGENPNLKKKSRSKMSKKLKSAILVGWLSPQLPRSVSINPITWKLQTAQRISSLDVNLRREKYSFISKLEGDRVPDQTGDGPNWRCFMCKRIMFTQHY